METTYGNLEFVGIPPDISLYFLNFCLNRRQKIRKNSGKRLQNFSYACRYSAPT